MRTKYLMWLNDQIKLSKEHEVAAQADDNKDAQLAWMYTAWALDRARRKFVTLVVVETVFGSIFHTLVILAFALAFIYITLSK